MNPTAGSQNVRVIEARGEFVTNHQEDRMTADGITTHQQTVVRRCGQGLRQQDTSLQVVDIIIEHRCEVIDPQNHPGIFVTDFDAQTLGAHQNVLTAQEIERPARPTEVIAPRHCTRVRGKPVQQEARLAKTGGIKGL